MEREWLEVHRKTESDYWWFVNKRRIVQRLLSEHYPERGALLEVGCGGGLLSSILQDGGWRVISADVDPAGAAFAIGQGLREGLAFDAGKDWPLADASVDTLVMLDVLEHIEDDVAALLEAYRVLKDGGGGVISVPAYQFLYSSWDAYNRHFRRYTTYNLAEAAHQAGFKVERRTYWNAVSLPLAIPIRLMERFLKSKEKFDEFPPVHPWVNDALIAYGKAEAAWLGNFRVPFGLSALIVVRKREQE